MIKIKLESLQTTKKKSYEVKEGQLYIDGEVIEIFDDPAYASWDVSEIEDFEYIKRNEAGELIMGLNVFTDSSTMLYTFSVIKRQGIIEDAHFPYTKTEDEILWEADITTMEGFKC